MGIFDIDDNINNIDKNIIEHVLTSQLSEEIAKNINKNIIEHILMKKLNEDIANNINEIKYIR